MVFLKEFLEKVHFENKSADDKKCAKLQMYHNALSIISFQKVDNE